MAAHVSILRFLTKLKFLSPAKRIEYYPPFWLMRVKVLELADDFSRVRIKLPLTMFSRNMGNAMFGGHQASLADPIPALACAKKFPGYSVWTRSLSVDFIREGNSHLELKFDFPEQAFNEIAHELNQNGKSTPTFELGIYREDGKMCTRISNTVAIRQRGYSVEKPSKDKN